MHAWARIPACVTVFAMHFMTSPSWGEHIKQSTSKLNVMFPADNAPTEWVRRLQDCGLTNPSGIHFPVIWSDTRRVSSASRFWKSRISEKGMRSLWCTVVVWYNDMLWLWLWLGWLWLYWLCVWLWEEGEEEEEIISTCRYQWLHSIFGVILIQFFELTFFYGGRYDYDYD